MIEDKRLMNVKELAKYLGLVEQTVYRMVSRGEIPVVKLGRIIRFRKSTINKWLNGKTEGGGKR